VVNGTVFKEGMKKYKIVYKPSPSDVNKSIEIAAMNIAHLIRRLEVDFTIDINKITLIKEML
jgi:hypothetical protein